LFFISIELGPTAISDARLITHVGFAALPKFYTDNSSIIQMLFDILLISYSNTLCELHLS
jgi:hypothetical protein